MIRFLAIGATALAGILGWLLLDAHEALNKAELAARINANTIKTLQDQETRNQAIDAKLEKLSGARDAEIRESVREIYIQPSSDACRKSAAMRALDGRLRYHPVVQTVDRPPPQRLLNPCKRPADRPDQGDDRDLAAWEAETWQRGHDCADRVDGWIEWWWQRPPVESRN